MEDLILTRNETERTEALTKLESRIMGACRRTFEAYLEISKALWQIREGGLYEDTGAESITAYARTKFGFERAATFRFCSTGETADILTKAGLTLPEKQNEFLALATVPPEARAGVWQECLNESNTTAERIMQLASEYQEDDSGVDVDLDFSDNSETHAPDYVSQAFNTIQRHCSGLAIDLAYKMKRYQLLKWAGQDIETIKNIGDLLNQNPLWSVTRALRYLEHGHINDDTSLGYLVMLAKNNDEGLFVLEYGDYEVKIQKRVVSR
jgi:hypothetical protein